MGAKPWNIAATFIITLGLTTFFVFRIFRLSDVPFPYACLLTALTLYSPPVLGIMGCSCKDTWVVMLFIGAIYTTVEYHRCLRWMFLVLRNVMIIVAELIRPEYVLIAILLLVLEFFVSQWKWRVRLWAFVSNLLAIVVLYVAINEAICHLEKVTRVHPVTFIYLSDLIDLSVAKNQLLIPDYYLNGSSLKAIRERYHDPDVNLVFYGPGPNLNVRWPMPEAEFKNLKSVWVEQLLKNSVRLIEHRLSIFRSYLWNKDFFSDSIDANDDGLVIFHRASDAFLLRYLYSFHNGILQRHFFVFFGSIGLIMMLILQRPKKWINSWLCAGLVCGCFYQCTFSILGLPPYPRFASAGVVFFWLVLYIVMWDFFRARVTKTKTTSV
jgi:hypothetical protein